VCKPRRLATSLRSKSGKGTGLPFLGNLDCRQPRSEDSRRSFWADTSRQGAMSVQGLARLPIHADYEVPQGMFGEANLPKGHYSCIGATEPISLEKGEASECQF
jgi:hypothetical protein